MIPVVIEEATNELVSKVELVDIRRTT